MNLWLRIRLYIMRKFFGKGPVDTVMGPLAKMLSDTEQVADDQYRRSAVYAHAAIMAEKEGSLAEAINTNLKNLMS